MYKYRVSDSIFTVNGVYRIVFMSKISRFRIMTLFFQNYQTIALQFIKVDEYDDELVQRILNKYLEKYPESITFVFYKG